MTWWNPHDSELEVLAALVAAHVSFVVVGGAAMQLHGMERPRKDLDILVEATSPNATALKVALESLQPPVSVPFEVELGFSQERFRAGVPYRYTELLGHIDGVAYADAKADAHVVQTHGLIIPFLSKHHLVKTKRIRGNEQDLADISFLETV
ncbi:hypothetical protein [Phyllobacterium pellucidum]|uniref:hypothetical protein n=1 Tax=Phyllobacterium pellucidum TaxID=2740464 RepID=UPI001D155F95|nr:hypothetical protein [Phyllobacterium sp. T1018]UGY08647.1 hypothetical protein LLE51_011420 [Phyllobacterium sp. T1018]